MFILKRSLFREIVLVGLSFICKTGISQTIKFDEIRVTTNFDSLNNALERQNGLAQLKTILSLEKGYMFWFKGTHPKIAPLTNLLEEKFPQQKGHINLFRASAANKNRLFTEAFNYASAALNEYKKNNDTLGIIVSLYLQGTTSISSKNIRKPFELQYFDDALKYSKDSKSIEVDLLKKYIEIRRFEPDSLQKHSEEIIKKVNEVEKLITQKKDYYHYLPSFYNALQPVYTLTGEINKRHLVDLKYTKLYRDNGINVSFELLYALGQDNMNLNKFKSARFYFRSVLKHPDFQNSRLFDYKFLFYHDYHTTLVKLRKFKEASPFTDSLFKYMQLYRFSENQRNITDLELQHELKQKTQEAQNLLQRNSIAKLRNRNYTIFAMVAFSALIITIFIAFLINAKKESLAKANKDIQKLTKSKEYFFGIIAHDLRQPLGALDGISQIFEYYLKSNNKDAIRKIAHTIEASGTRLLGTLDNLLKWSLMQKQDFHYKPEITLVYKQIKEIKKLYDHIINYKKIDFKIDCPKDLYLNIDLNGLHLILRNLVGNSLKFVQDNGYVSVKVHKTNQNTIFEINNNGPLIDAKKIKIINKVFKEYESIIPGEYGLGLGIVLVSQFVKINKGRIEVKSNIENGTTFTIYFN